MNKFAKVEKIFRYSPNDVKTKQYICLLLIFVYVMKQCMKLSLLFLYGTLLLFFPASGQSELAEEQAVRTIRVIDGRGQPVFGVYVINPKRNTLVTTSDLDGECSMHLQLFSPKDTLLFQGMGFTVERYSVQDLYQIQEITLHSLLIELEETTVRAVPVEEILKNAATQLQKFPRSTPPFCQFYGSAQYEKITEYRDAALEYRREYGYWFTSGDLLPKNALDQNFRSYFVPVYSARSLNLTNNGSDTLSPVYLTAKEARFDAGTRKVFTLLRAVQLYGPLFSDIRQYDFTPQQTDSTDYLFAFQTKAESYPDKTRITCKGNLVIDFDSHRVKRITFDYIDYQLYRQVLFTNQRKVNSPFSTRAEVVLDYTGSGQVYVRSCIQTTYWKYDLGTPFVLIEQPSRLQAAAGNLVEKEAFACYEYKPIKKEHRTQGVTVKIHVTHRNPQGVYDPVLFAALPQLLESEKAVRELDRYLPIEQQYRNNHGRTYYPDNFLNGFNGFTGAGRDDKAYRQNSRAVRTQLLQIFPPENLRYQN